jgi:hypothetical protein
MIYGFFFTPGLVIPIQMQWQSRHGFCKDTDTGINGSHLHSRTFGHGLASCTAAHKEAIATSRCSVLGLVPGTEQARKDTHSVTLPKIDNKKAPTIMVDAI